MDGYKATQTIRQLSNKDKATIPIIALTANAFEEDRKKAFEKGMNGHIAKPVDAEKLKKTILSALRWDKGEIFIPFGWNRRHFSKIRKDVNYVPNKKTVLAFTIALELSLDKAKDLLASAGFALSRSSKTDIIVAYFLQNKIYDIFELNFKAVGRAISKAKVLPVQ